MQKALSASRESFHSADRADEKKPSTVVEGFAVRSDPKDQMRGWQCRGLALAASTHGRVGATNAGLRSGRLGCRDVPLKERQHLLIENLVKGHPVKPCCIAADAGHCLGQRW